MVGRWISFWETLFLGAMWVSEFKEGNQSWHWLSYMIRRLNDISSHMNHTSSCLEHPSWENYLTIHDLFHPFKDWYGEVAIVYHTPPTRSMKLKFRPLVCTMMTNAEHGTIEQQPTHFKTYDIDQKNIKNLIKNLCLHFVYCNVSTFM